VTRETSDVIVAGAGPGGSAAAYALAERGVGVVLLDKAVFPREKVCGDGLTPRAVAALDAMDVLSACVPSRSRSATWRSLRRTAAPCGRPCRLRRVNRPSGRARGRRRC
jgi:2-polyprenyl-6-methoxyphenol hydroxylase-like FAD-dependent oxidoreductase